MTVAPYPIREHKLRPPAERTATIVRERVADLWAEVDDVTPLILVTAGAGYGKTSAL
jgi:ATP/maltotriose-dependent transcriptional regulator MalT